MTNCLNASPRIILVVSTLVVTSVFRPTFAEELDEVLGDLINDQLAEMDVDVQVHSVETFTTDEAMGRRVFFDDRTKQLPADFVPGDPRRGSWSGQGGPPDDITSIIDATQGSTFSGLTAAQTTAAITRAMNTWDSVKSTNIPINQNGRFGPTTPVDVGIVQRSLGFGGVPVPTADIIHAGFLPPLFFDLLEPDGGDFILGVTFTFIFLDQDRNPTDINDDGLPDVAFREIYYNDFFPWDIDRNVDVETVALHEAGHGLSQGHFGAAFRTRNGKLHFAPKAVMNAAYSGIQQTPTGTDIAGHSSIWASWPQR